MGQIIEINQPLTRNLLKAISTDPRVKSYSYGKWGAEVELNDELPEPAGDAFIIDFNKQLIRKKPPQGQPT